MDRQKHLNERQAAALRLLAAKTGTSGNAVGYHLAKAGLVKRCTCRRGNDCLAGSAVLRALKNRTLADYFLSSHDQWAVKLWFATNAGRDALRVLEGQQ